MPIYQLDDSLWFPPPARAPRGGLLAVGGDLRPERLLLAYRMGIFPWYAEDEPILWWSPNPRLVLFPDEFHVSRRLARVIRQGAFRVTFDTAFRDVIADCASIERPGQDGTWIMPEMIDAYCALHEAGYAHSVECWAGPDLAGGLYGVSLGGCFFGESMFSREPDASKVALAALIDRVAAWGFALVDCQVTTPHLVRMGAREVSRREFLTRLEEGMQAPTRVGRWNASIL